MVAGLEIESEDSDLRLQLFGHNGVFLTAGIIVADVVGAGILAMPVALANFGLYPGIVALLLLLAANVHISVVMWRVRMFCPTCIGTTTYTGFVRGAFAKAPAWQRRVMIWDHRLLPEIIHRGYDGPLFDECWKGHGYVILSLSRMPSSVDDLCSTIAFTLRGNGSTHELLAILGLAQRGDADGKRVDPLEFRIAMLGKR